MSFKRPLITWIISSQEVENINKDLSLDAPVSADPPKVLASLDLYDPHRHMHGSAITSTKVRPHSNHGNHSGNILVDCNISTPRQSSSLWLKALIHLRTSVIGVPTMANHGIHTSIITVARNSSILRDPAAIRPFSSKTREHRHKSSIGARSSDKGGSAKVVDTAAGIISSQAPSSVFLLQTSRL